MLRSRAEQPQLLWDTYGYLDKLKLTQAAAVASAVNPR